MTFDISRRGLLGIFAATTVVAAPVASNAFGVLRGAGNYRRISMYSGRTGESIDTVYWVDGKYIRDALNEINIFMRDWRTGTMIGIDPRTIDIATASHRLLGTSEPYMMLSGYRSPQTNAMLRSRSEAVRRPPLPCPSTMRSRWGSGVAHAPETAAWGGSFVTMSAPV